MRSFKIILKDKKWAIQKWSRGVMRTLSSFYKVMEYIDMIDQRQMTANWDIEVLRKQVEDQKLEIKTLEYKLENLDINEEIESALDSLDIESQLDDYFNYRCDLSDHIDFEDIAEKSLAMMVERLQQTV